MDGDYKITDRKKYENSILTGNISLLQRVLTGILFRKIHANMAASQGQFHPARGMESLCGRSMENLPTLCFKLLIIIRTDGEVFSTSTFIPKNANLWLCIGGGGERIKKNSRKRKLSEKNSCSASSPERKFLHTVKYSCKGNVKIPPPITFLMVAP